MQHDRSPARDRVECDLRAVHACLERQQRRVLVERVLRRVLRDEVAARRGEVALHAREPERGERFGALRHERGADRLVEATRRVRIARTQLRGLHLRAEHEAGLGGHHRGDAAERVANRGNVAALARRRDGAVLGQQLRRVAEAEARRRRLDRTRRARDEDRRRHRLAGLHLRRLDPNAEDHRPIDEGLALVEVRTTRRKIGRRAAEAQRENERSLRGSAAPRPIRSRLPHSSSLAPMTAIVGRPVIVFRSRKLGE